MFAVFDPSQPDRALSGARATLRTLLGDDEAASLEPIVGRLHRECSGRARLSHVGVMLGRSPAALRVQISDLPLRNLRGYLKRIGWAGDVAQVVELARMLLDHGDLMVLCLDVAGGELIPRAGLECFFAQRHGVDPRWPPLLDRLVELGLCAPEKATALLRWPGTTAPIDDGVRWPEDLIVRSLSRSPGELGVIQRRLSHVKLTYAPGAPVSAKAYFGYGHLWVPARPDISPPSPRRRLCPARTTEVALAAGIKRLLEKRNQGGWWRDFFDRARPADADRRVTGYASDEWVTAFVAAALATIPAAGARDAAHEALGLLLARRDGAAGWGYHALLPADADTTTWVLRLAASLGEPERGRLAAGRRLIECLTRPDGGVATYPEDAAGPLARFLNRRQLPRVVRRSHLRHGRRGALQIRPDDDVVPPRGADRERLVERALVDDDDEYTTARAVEALSRSPGNTRAVSAALIWCSDRIGPDGAVHSAAHQGPSPFATALALRRTPGRRIRQRSPTMARGCQTSGTLAARAPARGRLLGGVLATASSSSFRRRPGGAS